MNVRASIVTVISVGIGLGLLIVGLHQSTAAAIRDVQAEVTRLGTEVHQVREDVADLHEQMARLEALFERFARREAAE